MSKTTTQPGPPVVNTSVEDLTCKCCDPGQPLEEVNGDYVCPVTGKKHTYDPAMGGEAQLMSETQQNATTTNNNNEEYLPNRASDDPDDFYQNPPNRREARRIDPSREGFASSN